MFVDNMYHVAINTFNNYYHFQKAPIKYCVNVLLRLHNVVYSDFVFSMPNLDDSLAVFRRKLRPMADPSDSVIIEEDEVRLSTMESVLKKDFR